jgi:hypothetical protein
MMLDFPVERTIKSLKNSYGLVFSFDTLRAK